MSTSFTQDSPTEPTSGECVRMAAADIIKEWDSDTDSHTSNSSSGEFIWKVSALERWVYAMEIEFRKGLLLAI